MKQKVMVALLAVLVFLVLTRFRQQDSLETAAEALGDALEGNEICAAVFGLEDRGIYL